MDDMTVHEWGTPDGLRGEAHIIRLSASALDRDDRHCRDFTALKARPRVWPRAYERRRYAPWETFPLGLVMRALDSVEFHGADIADAADEAVTRNRSTVHPGVAVWVRHACDAYLQAAEWVADELEPEGVVLVPQRLPRVVQHESAAELRMLTAWGRWYASAGGRVREFRRLRMSRAGEPDAPSNDAMAFVAAAGQRAQGDVYRDLPVDVDADESMPTRVRVVEVVLAAGVAPRVLVDSAPDEIRRTYQQNTRHLVTLVVFGGGRRPGSDCVDCKARASCEALPRVPGLLGLGGTGTHRRTWSVTTGRQYLVCPAQAHLRELHIPAAPWADGSAVRRGRAVHRWLEAAHGRSPARACRPEDLPEVDAADLGLAAEVMTHEEYLDARPFLLAHLAVCPLDGTVENVVPEPALAVYDPAADVVVVAYPDLIREVGGRTVYREQKTTLAATPGEAPEEVFPRVRMTGEWHVDTAFRPNPGHWCAGCPVAQWCPDRAPTDPAAPIVVDGVRIDPRTGEVLDVPRSVSGRAAAVAQGIAEPGADDEPPF